MMDVKFLRGLSTKFATITPDSKTFYFLTDTNELYLGSVLLSNEVTAEEFAALEARVEKLELDFTALDLRVAAIELWKAALPKYVTTEAFQNWLTTVYEPEQGEQDRRIGVLETTIEGIVSVGGQANVIESITVDGVKVPVDGEKNAAIVLDKTYEKVGVAAGLVATEKGEREAADAELQAQIDKIEAVLPTLDTDTNTTYTLTHNVEAKELVLTPSEGAAQTVSLAGYEYAGVAEDLVKAEAEARAAADEDLQKAIDAETEAREAADEDLQKQIDAIEATLPTIDTNTTYTLSYDSASQEIVLTPSVGEPTKVDAKDFIIDGMLESVVADQTANTLTFTWNTASGKTETTVIELSSIADIYTGSTNAAEVNVFVSNENVISATIGANVADKIAHGETAHSWGNHAEAGYLKEHQSLAEYATIAYVDGKVKAEQDRAEGVEAGLQEQIDALEKKHTDEVLDLQDQIDALETKHIQEVADLDARLDKVELAVPVIEKDITDLEERVADLETGLEDEAKARAEADSALAERIDVIEDQLEGFDKKPGAVKDYIDEIAGACEQNFTTIVNQLTWGEF